MLKPTNMQVDKGCDLLFYYKFIEIFWLFNKGESHEPEIEILMRMHVTAGQSSAPRVHSPALRNST